MFATLASFTLLDGLERIDTATLWHGASGQATRGKEDKISHAEVRGCRHTKAVAGGTEASK